MRRALLLALAAALAVPAGAQLRVTKRADLAQPVVLGPNQAALVIGFRRPDRQSLGKSGMLAFARYDPEKRDVMLQPRGVKILQATHAAKADTPTYWAEAWTSDKKLALDPVVLVVTAGDYVLYAAQPGPDPQRQTSFCLGAPTFHVEAGEVACIGDFAPYLFVKLVDGTGLLAAMAYSSHPEETRAALAKRPELAAALKPAALANGATFGCAGQAMTAYEVPGAASLPPATSAPEVAPPVAPPPAQG